jgi:hypothetical protein
MRVTGDCLRDLRAVLLLRAADPRFDDALRDDALRAEERLLAADIFRPRALDALRAPPRRDDERDEPPRRLAPDFDPLRFDRLDEREELRDLLVFVAMS